MASTFLSTVARERGAIGFSSRREALEVLAGDLLPAELIARRSKASFNRSFFGLRSRNVVASWDGTGFDPQLVDADRLRRTWQEPSVDARSQWLLQAHYLSGLTRCLPAP
jgi:asparagine synthase (glutamine-hydrolysing)